MRIGMLKSTLFNLVSDNKQDRAIYVEGPIGLGKTDTINALADEYGFDKISMPIETMEFYDFKMNKVVDGKMRAFYTEDLPDDEPDSGFGKKTKGLLVFEDLTASDKQTVYAVMNFMLTGKIGSYELPYGWQIIATGNREEDGILTPIPKVVKTRFIVLKVDYNYDDFANFILNKYDKGKLQKNARIVLSFVAENKNALSDVTARVWEQVINLPFEEHYIEGQLGDYTASFLNHVKNATEVKAIMNAVISGKFQDVVVKSSLQFLVGLSILRLIEVKIGDKGGKVILNNILQFSKDKMNLEILAFVGRRILERNPEWVNHTEILDLLRLTGLDKV